MLAGIAILVVVEEIRGSLGCSVGATAHARRDLLRFGADRPGHVSHKTSTPSAPVRSLLVQSGLIRSGLVATDAFSTGPAPDSP